MTDQKNKGQTLFTIEQLATAIRWDDNGLVSTIIQDVSTKDVLMLAYMNRDSLQQSINSGQTWFWSRSRNELWNKGATSGHTQTISWLRYDCDADALLIGVEQTGAACHTGNSSCFYRQADLTTGGPSSVVDEAAANPAWILSTLEATIAQRDELRPEGAYTTYLFEKGIDKILKKVGEETAEVIIAAKNRDTDELRYESSDLIFHLMVLWRESGLSLEAVLGELSSRHLKKKGE
ncbi:MAG: bifunctional phosphoribosyl-AMP cyclohydrolase/phosphoribosyl-ATP diphosphatase HisIE [Paenibacillaceae bacterium]